MMLRETAAKTSKNTEKMFKLQIDQHFKHILKMSKINILGSTCTAVLMKKKKCQFLPG